MSNRNNWPIIQILKPWQAKFLGRCSIYMFSSVEKLLVTRRLDNVYLWSWNCRKFYLHFFFPFMTDLDLPHPFLLPWLGTSCMLHEAKACLFACTRQRQGQQKGHAFYPCCFFQCKSKHPPVVYISLRYWIYPTLLSWVLFELYPSSNI